MRHVLLMLYCILAVVGCSSNKEDISKRPTVVSFALVADEGMNPNVFGESSPIEVQVFELQDDSMFVSADFDQISQNYKKVLKSNFIEVYDYVLTPGQFKFVGQIELDEDTRYIGVIAKYSEPELSEWKNVTRVKNPGREYSLLMFFKDYDIKLEKVE